MKRIIRLVAVLFGAAALFGCVNSAEDGIKGNSSKPIGITVNVDNFTRATDTAFEEADRIGLFVWKDAENTFWLQNALYTYTSNGFAASSEYLWYNDDTATSTLIAYYPYSANLTPTDNGQYPFKVAADQSTHAGYTGSDLMTAVVKGVTPTADKIALTFTHRLSKVIINISNTTSDAVADVFMADIQGNCTFDTQSGVTATGGTGTIKGARYAQPKEGYTDSYALILPPQTSTPKIVVTTVSQKQYAFNVNEAQTFAQGKQRTANLTITPESVGTAFDTTVTDWSADDDFTFIPDIDTGWAVVGNFGTKPWRTEAVMTQDADGNYTVELEFSTLPEFMIIERMQGGSAYGGIIDDYCDWNTLSVSTQHIKLAVDGRYRLTFSPERQALKAYFIESSYYQQLGIGKMYNDALYKDGACWDVQVLKSKRGEDYVVLTPYADTQEDKFKYAQGYVYYRSACSTYANFTVLNASLKGFPYKQVKYSPFSHCISIMSEGSLQPIKYYHPSYSYISAHNNRVVADGNLQIAPIVKFGEVVYADYSGTNNAMTLVLPGYERVHVKDLFVDIAFSGTSGTSANDSQMVTRITKGADVSRIGMVVLQGKLTDSSIQDYMATVANGTASGYTIHELSNTVSEISIGGIPTGLYTVLAWSYTDTGAIGWYSAQHAAYVAAGDTPPACQFEQTVGHHPIVSDKYANFNFKGSDIAYVYSGMFEKSMIPDTVTVDKYEAFILTNGAVYSSSSYPAINSTAGMSGIYHSLKPQTEYRTIAAAYNSFGSVKVVYSDITTAAEPEWESLGTGTYSDRFYNYFNFIRTPVEIKKAPNVERYRVMNPYKAFWESKDDDFKSQNYTGSSAEWLEFFVQDYSYQNTTYTGVFFEPCKTGVIDSSLREEISLEHIGWPRNYTQPNVYWRKNKVVSDGVFQLAPMYVIVGTPYIYGMYQYDEVVIITLPGKSYTFHDETNGAAAPLGIARSVAPAAPQTYFGPTTKIKQIPRFRPARYTKISCKAVE